jgi:A/G-specific adenine glycosylase
MDEIKFLVNTTVRWFKENGRRLPWRKTTDIYKLLVAEKMLQRTQAKVVAKIYPRFISRYPTAYALANANVKEIEKLIKPLGLYKVRAREFRDLAISLKRGANVLSRNLRSIRGVGEYIEKAVRCFAFQELVLPLDANMKRLISRFLYGRDAAKIGDHLVEKIVGEAGKDRIKEFVWGLLDLEDEVCVPKRPKCHGCPLTKYCSYFRGHESIN